jgi:hypothetical protein
LGICLGRILVVGDKKYICMSKKNLYFDREKGSKISKYLGKKPQPDGSA